MKISVIVAVYQRYKHLYWCLKGLRNQSVGDFEVIVADDGSNGSNLAQIGKIIKDYSSYFKIKHVWHEDNGNRKTLILNKGVKESNGDVLIFLDCDVIPEKKLVETYLFYYKKYKKLYEKLLFTGDLISLKKEISDKILNDFSIDFHKAIETIERSFSFTDVLYRKYRHLKYFYYSISKVKYPKGWGANICLNRKAFFDVNGFNNDFYGRGEDTDFLKRLVINGTKRISLNAKTKVYHLFHDLNIEPDSVKKEKRKKLKWKYYKENPEIIIAKNGVREI